MLVVTIATFILFALFIGCIFLQIFLSKKKNKYLGLILPMITFMCSLLSVLNVYAPPGVSKGEIFGTIATVFIGNNIPTVILMGIYLACREKIKVNQQLEKMNIQDLD